MYVCMDDRYDNSGLSYETVDEFLEMVAALFGEELTLRYLAEGYYDEDGRLILGRI